MIKTDDNQNKKNENEPKPVNDSKKDERTPPPEPIKTQLAKIQEFDEKPSNEIIEIEQDI